MYTLSSLYSIVIEFLFSERDMLSDLEKPNSFELDAFVITRFELTKTVTECLYRAIL